MSSKRWTIVCLTLTLLIFGCSDSEVTKVTVPALPNAVENAAALSSRTAPGAHSASVLPPHVDVNEPLDIPPTFQPPGLKLPTVRQVPFEGNPQLPPLPGFDGMADVPVHFPGRGNVASPRDPKETLGPGRNEGQPGFPPELPGFELPGFEGAPGAELLRLRLPGAIPTPAEVNEPQSTVSG